MLSKKQNKLGTTVTTQNQRPSKNYANMIIQYNTQIEYKLEAICFQKTKQVERDWHNLTLDWNIKLFGPIYR